MQSKVSKLIADIECAEKALFEIISREDEPDSDHLARLDGQLEQSFNLLLTARLNAAHERVERVRYLLFQVEKHADCSKLLSTMTSVIMEDVMAVFAGTDGAEISQSACTDILEHSVLK